MRGKESTNCRTPHKGKRQRYKKRRIVRLNSDKNVQECDATDDATGTIAG
jgi:hypothetical protein